MPKIQPDAVAVIPLQRNLINRPRRLALAQRPEMPRRVDMIAGMARKRDRFPSQRHRVRIIANVRALEQPQHRARTFLMADAFEAIIPRRIRRRVERHPDIDDFHE